MIYPALNSDTTLLRDIPPGANTMLLADGRNVRADNLLRIDREDVDREEVINGGTGQSNATTWKIPEYVLSERFDAGFTIGQYLKDMATAIAIADRAGAPMEVSRGATAAWRAIAETLAASDHTFAAKVVADAQETRGDRE